MTIITRFFRWWAQELTALTPRFVRGLALRRQPVLAARAGEQGDILLRRLKGRRSVEIGALTDQPRRRIRQFAQEARRGDLTIAFTVPPEGVVSRRVKLPLAAEEDLHSVLGYELDRLTPFRATELYYAAAIAERAPESGRLEVDLIFLPRANADPALTALRDAGLPATRLDVSNAEGGLRGFDLLPKQAGRGMSFETALAIGFGGLLALMLGVWAFMALDHRERRAEALRDAVFVARRAALATQERDLRDAAATDAAAQAYQLKRAAPMTVETLSLITEALPDGTWLETLTINGAEIELSGFSSDAAALIDRFTASPTFSDPEFRAPITRDGDEKSERFSLSVTLKSSAGGERP